MTVVADNYARVLMDMNISAEDLAALHDLLTDKRVFEALENPFVSHQSKRNVVDKLFPAAVRSFVKVMCDNGDIDQVGRVAEAYHKLRMERANIAHATFKYVTKPDDAQIEKLKKLICKKYGKSDVELNLVEDPSLVGGFVLIVGEYVLDKSLKTAIANMQRHFAVR